jgi:hypothetical protein
VVQVRDTGEGALPARSRQFRRVSTGQQDYRKQLAALDAWDVSHGYIPGTPYVSDGLSAYHGKHIPDLEKASPTWRMTCMTC